MRITSRVLLAGLGLALAAGCGGGRTDRPVVTRADGEASASPSGTDAAGRGKTLVRLVNAMPSRQGIDVSSDDRTVFTDVTYRTVTPYAEVGDNMVNFRLRATGSDSVLADNHEMMTDGYRYTIVALPDERGNPHLRVLKDDLVPDPAQARVRVINAAPDLGNVDVAMQGRKEALFDDVHYGTEAGYKDVAPVSGTVDIRSDVRTRRPIQLENVRFEAGKAYTIVLAGWGTGVIETITFNDAVDRGVNGLSLGVPGATP